MSFVFSDTVGYSRPQAGPYHHPKTPRSDDRVRNPSLVQTCPPAVGVIQAQNRWEKDEVSVTARTQHRLASDEPHDQVLAHGQN
jgi:hypothetical protein